MVLEEQDLQDQASEKSSEAKKKKKKARGTSPEALYSTKSSYPRAALKVFGSSEFWVLKRVPLL